MNRSNSIAYNRLALAGVLVYAAEWIFILGFYPPEPPPEATTSQLMTHYSTYLVDANIYTVGTMAAVLGLLAFGAGVRGVLGQVQAARPSAELGFAALVVAVGLEVAGLGESARLAAMAASGVEPAAGLASARDASAGMGGMGMALARGLFAVAMGVALLGANVVPRWIGVAAVAGGLLYASGSALLELDGGPGDWAGLVQFAGWLLSFAFMLATGIVFFRRAGRAEERPATMAPVR